MAGSGGAAAGSLSRVVSCSARPLDRAVQGVRAPSRKATVLPGGDVAVYEGNGDADVSCPPSVLEGGV